MGKRIKANHAFGLISEWFLGVFGVQFQIVECAKWRKMHCCWIRFIERMRSMSFEYIQVLFGFVIRSKHEWIANMKRLEVCGTFCDYKTSSHHVFVYFKYCTVPAPKQLMGYRKHVSILEKWFFLVVLLLFFLVFWFQNVPTQYPVIKHI